MYNLSSWQDHHYSEYENVLTNQVKLMSILPNLRPKEDNSYFNIDITTYNKMNLNKTKTQPLLDTFQEPLRNPPKMILTQQPENIYKPQFIYRPSTLNALKRQNTKSSQSLSIMQPCQKQKIWRFLKAGKIQLQTSKLSCSVNKLSNSQEKNKNSQKQLAGFKFVQRKKLQTAESSKVLTSQIYHSQSVNMNLKDFLQKVIEKNSIHQQSRIISQSRHRPYLSYSKVKNQMQPSMVEYPVNPQLSQYMKKQNKQSLFDN